MASGPAYHKQPGSRRKRGADRCPWALHCTLNVQAGKVIVFEGRVNSDCLKLFLDLMMPTIFS